MYNSVSDIISYVTNFDDHQSVCSVSWILPVHSVYPFSACRAPPVPETKVWMEELMIIITGTSTWCDMY